MEKEITIPAKIALLLFIYLFIFFFWQGVTTIPSEGDSLAYHIPIAESILDGTVFYPSTHGYALEYYPGSAELLLAALMFFHMPLNLFNMIGWFVLAFLALRLGQSYNLSTQLSLIFSVCSTTTIGMIRLLNNQTIDIWLAVFFVWSLLLLRHPKKSLRYFFLLGVSIGFLVGAKFSGPIYLLILLVIYGKKLLAYLSSVRIAVVVIPFVLFGASWYLRNLFLTGNPFYPQSMGFLPGDSDFHLMEWVGWKTLLFYPNGIVLMIFAFFSEYMLWVSAPIISLVYLYRNKKISGKGADIRDLIIIGLANLIVFFFLPSTGNNIITYLRYLFPAFIPLILVVFLLSERYKKLPLLLPLALMNSLLLVSFTSHQPKLFGIFLILSSMLILKYDILIKRLTLR